MATAVKPLRLDGRSSAANVEVCGWGHPPRSHHQAASIACGARSAPHHDLIKIRFQATELPGKGSGCSAVERGHRRHNGRARTIGQLCCSIARKRVRYLRRCRSAGDVSAACGGGGSLRCSWRCTSPAVSGITTDTNEAPSALADGAEARGSEKERAAQQARGLRDLRRRLILPPPGAPRMRKASKQPTKHIHCAPFRGIGCAYGLCRR
jgi:hypothetical protein